MPCMHLYRMVSADLEGMGAGVAEGGQCTHVQLEKNANRSLLSAPAAARAQGNHCGRLHVWTTAAVGRLSMGCKVGM